MTSYDRRMLKTPSKSNIRRLGSHLRVRKAWKSWEDASNFDFRWLTPEIYTDSSFDSPYRTGRHVPLGQGRNGLTSIATASDSRADITSPYQDERIRGSSSNLADMRSPASPSLHSPYSPGMRSASAQRASMQDGLDQQSPGEIPMQSFENGVAPPPPVEYSWSRIDKWCDENYPELFDQLCEGCTNNDLNELEHQLNCSLPVDVRESLQVHDGQERPGLPTGIIFSNMLLDCEEMVQEWDNWRRINEQYLLDSAVAKPAVPSRALGGGSGSSSSGEASSSKTTSPPPKNPQMWRQDLISRQDCVPANAIQKAYAHPGWIPLVRDWGGNNLAVDLAPGPTGRWGQIILFGRDYDTKYVVARSWAHFLGIFADDLSSGKWYVDEDSNELKLREFKAARVEPPYFDILRWRMDQKYKRGPPPKRMSMMAGGSASPTSPGSPYLNPSEANNDRGRSLNRMSSGGSPMISPNRPGYGKSSPLAKVTEEKGESSNSSKSHGKRLSVNTGVNGTLKPVKLVEVDTPCPSEDGRSTPRLDALKEGDAKGKDKEPINLLSAKADGKRPITMLEDGLKTIEI
ncbi:uncharacterized protein MKZ38_001228 [Zalerion maritima]|uniref:Knr4/Smi1-like domain-containing protein n=1 Tax=Zalerion maritima TaxID=339359 RepID=A0AAD5WTY9_9PEZI|nr:uncharacterized protein MKZ38_001228 [Zalerion maritima]